MAEPEVTPAATPESTPAAEPTPEPGSVAALREAAQASPLHVFGDGVYTWDDDRRPVILAVPADHPALAEIRWLRGIQHGTVEDSPESRSWVQECVRGYAQAAYDAPDVVLGTITAQGVHACMGALAYLAELRVGFWWGEGADACLTPAVRALAFRGDAVTRPLAACASIGYDPAAPRPSGWLAARCADIVAAHPNERYPTDPAGFFPTGEPLPSCWEPRVGIIEAHADERVSLGLPDSPHECYHAFLGYVWARQTDRDRRSPHGLVVGCDYRAFQALP
ncbi:hypothetical protein [Candidatus Poriferisocius sp.]|uniref:hypothetical protein n=1 Tax=Candidatus Poriferisocius sp. TaxID=3101276 RepID=UPI003B5CA18B